MSDSAAFELACDVIEADTILERIETRGTIRLALKEAGLSAKSVSPQQLTVVVDKLLPRELTARGVANPGRVCDRLRDELDRVDVGALDEAPEALFVRMGEA